ncbi:ATP-dependent acyl-CoA ligase [Herbiconiux sp. P15]|uniref:ATP-dependent acyl-CoA ligase n=1 Tax=Herbiconiux liukaitaii TaxID=3342799 RepID=UPI0035B7C96D
MTLSIQRCGSCATPLFPRRLSCPTCGSFDLHEARAVDAVVESLTTTAGGVVLVTADYAPGHSLVGRLLGSRSEVEPGIRLPLTSTLVGPRPAVFVPDPQVDPEPRDPHRLSVDNSLLDATIPGMLLARAASTPEAMLFRAGETRRTASEMVDAVARAAGALQARGIARGDAVAIMSENRVELLDVILGAAWMGAVAVPLNAAARGAQLHHVLANSQAKLLVIEPELLEHLDGLPALPDLEGVRVLGEPEPVAQPVTPADVSPGDLAAILYTSGTTGVSKGVLCPHAQFPWWGHNVSSHLGIRSDDVLYTCLPLYHTNALNAFSQAVVTGAEFVLGERFSASRFWQRLADSGATVTYLLGVMASILEGRAPSPLDRAHTVRVALAPTTPARLVSIFAERFGFELLDSYGSTETNGIVSMPRGVQRPGYIGRLMPGFAIRVVDADGSEVPAGTPGELLVRSDQPFSFASGYHRMPEATAAAWQDLWFHTGDRVVIEADGWVRFVDRIKDVIRRRGENISSVEVEQVLRDHPDISDVAVYAVDSELGEDEVMAAVVAREGHTVDLEDLAEFCRPRLAAFAIPRFFRVLDALPLTDNGKVRKPELRKAGTVEAWDRVPARIVSA